jgi:hypothetical protein
MRELLCNTAVCRSFEQLRDGGWENACCSEGDAPMMELLDEKKQPLNRRGYSLVEGG